jgi:hypothetical protein
VLKWNQDYGRASKGYMTLGECLKLCSSSTANAPWVKVEGIKSGTGGARAASFAVLPSVKTFKGLDKPSALKTAATATSCEETVEAGEVTSMDTIGKLVLTPTGCTVTGEGGKSCTVKSVGAKEGEIVTHTLKGELGTTKSTEAASGVALWVLPETTKTWAALAETPCTPESIASGSLAAEVLPIGEKNKYIGLEFEVFTGKQSIQLVTVPSGVKKPALTAFGESATEELEGGIEFSGEVEIV